MIGAGVDAGSRTIKVVLLDMETAAVLGAGTADQGVEPGQRAEVLYGEVLDRSGLRREDVARIVATGYGRDAVAFAHTTVTEITCHARGVHHRVPGARTVIDIGGQDSKVIRLDREGGVRDFAMNDRCAAGTGCFLELVARRLDVPLERLAGLASSSREPAIISSTCVVFAESEIVGLLAAGRAAADIAAGVQKAIAARLAALAGRTVEKPIVFTGGVALLAGMRAALQDALQQTVETAPDPRLTGALGAAILAARRPPQQEVC